MIQITFLDWKRLKSVNSRLDWAGRAREAQKYGPLWTRLLPSRVSRVSTATGIKQVLVAKCRTVVTVGLACCPCVSKATTVAGIGRVVVAKRRTGVAFGLACCACSQKCKQSLQRVLRGCESRFRNSRLHADTLSGSWPPSGLFEL